ncbi:putative bifunctional diguanylate cyclase/phosphodiesterase [Rhizobium sp. SL86]|uniref:putative bifunctional diguanylate cyclase/phosphodiesterase n=1 Tax=Rhizobium sp. SL86 TaxID=2995148 RepID=UPI002273D1C6|nr:EAL domain-containing protein [Rhizobium sp. SL86]MCY1665254.1 EAL domain-containing protein [Rhizobium sp. SL86]
MNIYARKAVWQAWLLGAVGVAAFAVFVHFDAYELLLTFLQEHEDYELDEVLLALDIFGLLSLIYGILRLWDFRQEKTRRQKAESQVDWMALHDHLTGLQNRHSLERRLRQWEEAPNSTRKFSVLMIDLDGFKRINDLVGHHAGDVVLTTIAARLREHVADDNLFRMGGDEFVAVIDTPSLALPVATALLQSLNRPVPFHDTTLDVGASIGVATAPTDGATGAECLRAADAAMYAAKSAGRGKVQVFDAAIRERAQRRDLAERNLRHAVAYGGIRPFYQPIIDLHSGKISGFEALARWQMEDGSFISPVDFIPLAEESGLMTKLTDLLLRQACRDAAGWPADTRLSFNISPIQLKDRMLGLRILAILMETGFDPRRLEIEITETALIQDLETAASVLSELRTAGISVALDDFGTGYSNLAQLSNFSFDKIKIDRSFVTSFQDQQKQEKIVRAIVGLGIGLEVPTTAEGIETEDQLSSLSSMGCTYGQGFLFGKAIPADEALRMFDATIAVPLRA